MLSEVIDQIESRGEKRGKKHGRRAAAVRMLQKGYDVEEVMEITELAREEVTTLTDIEFDRDSVHGVTGEEPTSSECLRTIALGFRLNTLDGDDVV